jgi:uncharacterized SAM-binding protein YcdF (DUF218 family)
MAAPSSMPDLFELKLLLRTLLLPPTAPLLLMLAGLLMWRRRPAIGRGLTVAGLLLAWGLATGLAADLICGRLEAGQRPLSLTALQAARNAPNPPRAIVILGSGAVRDGNFTPTRERVNSRTLERVMAGARQARASGLPILVSGGTPEWLTHSEAELMRRVLVDDLGLAVSWVEDRSRDTAENASFSAAMLRAQGIDSIVLVTHAYHMPRAQAVFESAGLKVLASPHDWRGGKPDVTEFRDWLPSASSVETVWLALHESLGLLWYRLRGHV